MSPWKVILATLVIFVAGLVTGVVVVRQVDRASNTPTPVKNSFIPGPIRDEYVAFIARELKLNPEQRKAIAATVRQSQERVRILYDLIGPDLREELRFTREEIRSQLNPEQRKRFDELPKRVPRRPNERDQTPADERRTSTGLGEDEAPAQVAP